MDFPENEADILKLAQRLVEEMERDPERWRDAPVSAAELRAQIEVIRKLAAESAEAERRSLEAQIAKDESLRHVKEVLGEHLMFTEVDVDGQPERLSGLGWGGRPGATDRELPAQVRDLTVRKMGDSSVALRWRPPHDGGPAAEYRMQRRRLGGPWEYVATAVDNHCILFDQPCGIEFDVRVVAVNKAGAGEPSDSITVVL